MEGGSILITGATGTFGHAFVRAILGSYERICIYSRGEHTQAAMRESLEDHPSLRWFIGDVRDRDRLRRAMTGCQCVVHAAALKRIEVGAYNPMEVVKTNVVGAMNVVEAATDADVQRVVALSTDKAWQPIGPYGYSKALAESIFLAHHDASGKHGPGMSVVRYGNVWGSAGSVVPRWRQLIAQGHTSVPVTDPDCTRFFMRVQTAVDIVRGALQRPEGGELIVPTDLPVYRLGDLAEAFGVQMRITGLPSHEKLHEGMLDGLTSDKARRMTLAHLRGEIDGHQPVSSR